jgi:hypothetical protein
VIVDEDLAVGPSMRGVAALRAMHTLAAFKSTPWWAPPRPVAGLREAAERELNRSNPPAFLQLDPFARSLALSGMRMPPAIADAKRNQERTRVLEEVSDQLPALVGRYRASRTPTPGLNASATSQGYRAFA